MMRALQVRPPSALQPSCLAPLRRLRAAAAGSCGPAPDQADLLCWHSLALTPTAADDGEVVTVRALRSIQQGEVWWVGGLLRKAAGCSAGVWEGRSAPAHLSAPPARLPAPPASTHPPLLPSAHAGSNTQGAAGGACRATRKAAARAWYGGPRSLPASLLPCHCQYHWGVLHRADMSLVRGPRRGWCPDGARPGSSPASNAAPGPCSGMHAMPHCASWPPPCGSACMGTSLQSSGRCWQRWTCLDSTQRAVTMGKPRPTMLHTTVRAARWPCCVLLRRCAALRRLLQTSGAVVCPARASSLAACGSLGCWHLHPSAVAMQLLLG